jgi:predicted aspartyl protease
MKRNIIIFTILLNFYWAHSQENKIVIPFSLSEHNNIIFKVVVNGVDSLNLKFDTGTTGLLLTHEAIKEKTNLLINENTPTKNYVKLKSLVSLKLGELQWSNLEVYPVMLSGQGTDGRFGWDLFKQKVVVIDYNKMKMTVQNLLPDVSNYTSSKLIETKTVLCINGDIQVDNRLFSGNFLVDTGYQKTILLDSVLMQEQHFPKDLKLLKVNRLRNGAGETFITKVVELPSVSIGKQVLKEVPVQLLNKPNPAGFKTHILGNEILKRFNTIIDFKNMTIYFQKNSLIDLPYTDAS